MKVLLSHGYFLNEDEAESKIMMPYPPQGILHIATYLNSKGLDCQVFDSTFRSFADLGTILEKEQPKHLGLYTNLMTRQNILEIIRFVKNLPALKNTVIILGGPDVRHHASLYLQHGADYCVPGEGEITFYQLIQKLEANDIDGIRDVKGLYFQYPPQEIVFTGDSEMTNNLDELPFPDFELIDIQEYFTTWKSFHGYSSITISTMRGCPYSCRWCSKAVFGRSFRRRSAHSVVKEMARLQMLYSPDRFWIVDDVFTINKQWLIEFRNAIANEGIKIYYECITRADRMDDEIIELLKESGCFRVWIGAESGSQKVLDQMDRGVKAEIVRDMIGKTKTAGIEAGTFLMLGYPGETENDILETVKHLKSANPDHYTITLSYPIPGTDFYDDVKESGLHIPGEWGTYSDRELDFERTYQRSYYRYAISYINHAVKQHQYLNNQMIIKSTKHAIISIILRIFMHLNK